jgi:cytochrome b6-f complex iron-sulfur subunit
MKTPPTFSRRDFINVSTKALLALGGLLGLGGLLRFFSYQPPPDSPTRFEVGDIANYPEGSSTIRLDIPAVIFNHQGRIVAYSLTCTHLGCTIGIEAEGFLCPCHGSRYDLDGKVLEGPAQEPLKMLHVETTSENAVVLYKN